MSLAEKIKNEPVLVTTLVEALIFLGTSFGLGLTQENVAAIMGLTFAVLGFYAREKVTPMAKVDSYLDDQTGLNDSDELPEV